MDREKYLIYKYKGLKTETLERWLKENLGSGELINSLEVNDGKEE